MVTLANVENDALLITLADRLAEVEVKTIGEEKAEEEMKA